MAGLEYQVDLTHMSGALAWMTGELGPLSLSLFKCSLLYAVAESPDLLLPRRKKQKYHFFQALLIKVDTVPVSQIQSEGK